MPDVVAIEPDGASGYIVHYSDGTYKHVDADGVPLDATESYLSQDYYAEPPSRAGIAGAGFGQSDPTNPFDPSATGNYGYPAPAHQRMQEADMAGPQGPLMSAPPPGFGGGVAPQPAYANGQLHPAWGGQALQPGGYYRGPNPGQGRGQQQIYANGVAAGPFDTHAASAPSSHSYGGSSSSGGGGGGGSSLYQAWRSKLTSKLYPGSGSGYSSYGSHSGGYKAPDPKVIEPRMRGPYAKGMDPTQATGLYTRPTTMIPRVTKGSVPMASGLYGDLEQVPASEYAWLATSRKKVTDRNQPAQYVNALGRTYANAVEGDLPDPTHLFNELMNTKNRSSLGGMMNPRGYRPEQFAGYTASGSTKYRKGPPQYDTAPVADATNTFQRMIDAIGTQYDPDVAAAQHTFTSRLLDAYGARQLNKDPRKMAAVWRQVTPHVISGMA